MSFYFRRWACSPSVTAMWLCGSGFQDPRPMAIPSGGLGHPAPAPAHSRFLPHTALLQTPPWLLTWDFWAKRCCECCFFPRGFTSPHGAMPFASPACREGRVSGGMPEPVALSSPHAPAGSSRPTAGRAPSAGWGNSGRAMAAPLRGGSRHKAEAFPMPRWYPVMPSARSTMIPIAPGSAGRKGELQRARVGRREDEGRSRGLCSVVRRVLPCLEGLALWCQGSKCSV